MCICNIGLYYMVCAPLKKLKTSVSYKRDLVLHDSTSSLAIHRTKVTTFVLSICSLISSSQKRLTIPETFVVFNLQAINIIPHYSDHNPMRNILYITRIK